jgi:hypothetical protein
VRKRNFLECNEKGRGRGFCSKKCINSRSFFTERVSAAWYSSRHNGKHQWNAEGCSCSCRVKFIWFKTKTGRLPWYEQHKLQGVVGHKSYSHYISWWYSCNTSHHTVKQNKPPDPSSHMADIILFQSHETAVDLKFSLSQAGAYTRKRTLANCETVQYCGQNFARKGFYCIAPSSTPLPYIPQNWHGSY